MSNIKNIASPIALGIGETREGAALVASGVVRIAEGVKQAWLVPLRWSYGEGDNLVEGFFSLSEMFIPVRKADGSEDKRALTAKYEAVAAEYSMVGEFTNADKVQFRRGWQIGAAAMTGLGLEFVNVDVERGGKRATVRVVKAPAGVVLDLYNEDGTATKDGKLLEADMQRAFELAGKEVTPEALVEACKSTLVPCKGGKLGGIKLPSVTDTSNKLAAFAVEAGFMPAPDKRNRNGDNDNEGKRFTEAVAFVTSCLETLRTSDESAFAPCDAIDESLHKLQGELVAYFDAANPAD